jgi:hypothetical protein
MLGNRPIGSAPLASGGPLISRDIPLSLSGLVIPVAKTSAGTLIKATSLVWASIAEKLGSNRNPRWHWLRENYRLGKSL